MDLSNRVYYDTKQEAIDNIASIKEQAEAEFQSVARNIAENTVL